MSVLLLGGESTGGRWVASWIRTAGLHVEHLSWPHGPDDRGPRRYPHGDAALWAGWFPHGRIVVLVREPSFVEQSAPRAHPVDGDLAALNVLDAVHAAVQLGWDNGLPVRMLVYEALVAHPEYVARSLGRWLGVPLAPPADVFDADAAWTAA